MVANGCRAAVAETSSHALHQQRTAALRFDVAVFTNLTRDHLDYHETMEHYADAKALLFESLDERAWAVVNADDPYADVWLKKLETLGRRFIRFSVDGRPAEIQVSSARLGRALADLLSD